MGKGTLKAIGYARVSTPGQRANGSGLERQADAIREVVGTYDLELVAAFTDAVSGATPPDERDGLGEALAFIKQGHARVLVIESLDRLARELHVQEAALQVVWSLGGDVYTPDGEVRRDDPDDPTRTFVRQVLGATAQLERGLIRKRMQAGRRAKKLAGGYVGGQPPYGFAYVGGELRPDPHEQRVLDQVAELARRRPPMKVAAIARHLRAEGVRTRAGRPYFSSKVLAPLVRRARA